MLNRQFGGARARGSASGGPSRHHHAFPAGTRTAADAAAAVGCSVAQIAKSDRVPLRNAGRRGRSPPAPIEWTRPRLPRRSACSLAGRTRDWVRPDDGLRHRWRRPGGSHLPAAAAAGPGPAGTRSRLGCGRFTQSRVLHQRRRTAPHDWCPVWPTFGAPEEELASPHTRAKIVSLKRRMLAMVAASSWPLHLDVDRGHAEIAQRAQIGRRCRRRCRRTAGARRPSATGGTASP